MSELIAVKLNELMFREEVTYVLKSSIATTKGRDNGVWAKAVVSTLFVVVVEHHKTKEPPRRDTKFGCCGHWRTMPAKAAVEITKYHLMDIRNSR